MALLRAVRTAPILALARGLANRMCRHDYTRPAGIKCTCMNRSLPHLRGRWATRPETWAGTLFLFALGGVVLFRLRR